jgi:hypothetical protein
MNDLLSAVRTGEGGGIGRHNYDPEAPSNLYPPNESEKDMQSFFKLVEDIKTDMADIKGKQRDLQEQHEKSKTIVRSKEMQRHREEMQVTTLSIPQQAFRDTLCISSLQPLLLVQPNLNTENN